uniref:BPI fold containing family B member 6 n=1 Tax=Anser brachyrhynchus TaxID=132585 RepID=A0A8B9CV94_9AVES
MPRIWCILLLGGWLAVSQSASGPGAVLRMDIGTIDPVSTALNESNVLQKLVEEATKKKPNTKPIKGISRLKVIDLRPPVISLTLSPGVGLFMAVLVQMTITGRSFIGGNMEIKVAANLTASARLAQDTQGCPWFSTESCHIALLSAKTNLPSSSGHGQMLSVPQGQAAVLLGGDFQSLASSFFPAAVIPLGTAGTLRYALLNPPVTSEPFIQLDLRVKGEEVDLPADQPSLTSLPPKREAATQLILSAGFLRAELSVMQASFSLNISNNMSGELERKGDVTLWFVSPQLSMVLPPSQPLVIEMREANPPLVTIAPDKSIVHLFSTAEFRVSSPDSDLGSLFVLDVHSDLRAQFAVVEERLQLSLALDSGGIAPGCWRARTYHTLPVHFHLSA